MSIAVDLEQEFELFHQFVKEKLKAEPHVKVSLEESLVRFREYQAKLDALRSELEPACQAIERGEAIPWDAAAVLETARERLKKKGIV
ncbi:hypothetical protein [Lacunimicrobium album]